MPSKHMVTGSNPVGEAMQLLVATRMSTEIDPKGGATVTPTEKYPSGEMVYATELESVEKQGS